VVRVADRDRILTHLHGSRIDSAVHYPVPIHLQGAFEYLGYKIGDLPKAEAAAGEIVSLPIFPGITEAQVERVAHTLTKAVRGAA
jgi:dTDP-4-amino-4,6-dideoxygalactose transaminase